MTVPKFYIGLLVVLAAVFGYLAYRVVAPFLPALVWALAFSIIFYPLYTLLVRHVRWRSLASFIVLCVIIALIAGPVSYLAVLLGRELLSLTASLESGGITSFGDVARHPFFREAVETVADLLSVSEEQVTRTITDNLSTAGRELAFRVTGLAESLISTSFNLFLMAVAVFFFLRDGATLFGKVRDSLPFPEERKETVAQRVRDILFSTMYGGGVIAVVQGLLGGIAFFGLGLPSPVLWGFVMAVASFLPAVGTLVVWGPVTLYLIFTGEIVKGIILVAVGVFGISMVDEFLRPYVIGNRARMPFPVLFFSIIGGVQQFGVLGLIVGPTILVIFASLLEVLRGVETK